MHVHCKIFLLFFFSMSLESKDIQLARDCEAVQIPSGQVSMLPSGMEVYITQELGGTYTVRTAKGLYQIHGKDGDALGRSPEAATPTEPKHSEQSAPSDFDEKYLWEALRSCFDPEIPVNIVDLGLIYDLRSEMTDGGRRVEVKMTLTAPGCGMGPSIADDAQRKLLMISGVEDASVEIVWDPPWHQSMITPEGRKALGL
jgi:probable FeS assembly SUF system protein SufT